MSRGSVVLLLLAACGNSEPTLGGPETIPSARVDRILDLFNKGVALMDRYQPVEAAKAFEQVVGLAPSWSTGRLNLGIALMNAQKDSFYPRAEQELKRVANAEPDNPIPHYTLGMLLRHLNRNDEAQKQFERVLQIDPDDGYAHYQMAVVVAAADPAAARRHLEKALERVPHHESACYRLQALLRQSGDDARAGELLRRFQALKAAGAGVTSGFKYGDMGPYAEVVRTFGLAGAGGAAAATAFEDKADSLGLSHAGDGTAGWPTASPDRVRELGAAAFRPGLAVADVDIDGALDVLLTTSDGVALFRNTGGRLAAAEPATLAAPGAVGAYCGDYDADGDPDLYVTCAGPNRLFRNDGGWRFTDVTNRAGVGGGPRLATGAQWADADHDGDLDLYVASYCAWPLGAGARTGARNALFRNNGNGTFTDVAGDAGIDGGDAPTLGVLFLDADGDRDLDVYVIHDRARNAVFLNDRAGRYRDATADFPALADEGPGTGALLADVDGNGLEDVLLLRGSERPRLLVQASPGIYRDDERFAAAAPAAALGAALGDWDLDGDVDVALLDAPDAGGGFRHRLLVRHGDGAYVPFPFGGQDDAVRARGSVACDLDGDGGLELLVARAGEAPQVWRAPRAPDRHWLQVVPGREPGKGPGLEPKAAGLLVEVKTGRNLQLRRLQTGGGFLSSPPLVAHFGLTRGSADYVRLTWSDAALQSELEVPGDAVWRVHRVLRRPSSCPLLFTWNGEEFAFVADFLGVGGCGFFVAPGVYAPPDPTETVRIPPELVAPRDGRYLLRVAEPLEEVTYFDQLELRVYDHPAELELHTDERFAPGPPFPTGEPRFVRQKTLPEAARDERGRDVLPQVLTIDRDCVAVPKDPRRVGFATDHWLELDFGSRLRGVTPDARKTLYLFGWTEYTYSHVNYAAWQAELVLRPPVLEVPGQQGGWRVALENVGFPAGLQRMMTVDVTDLPLHTGGRLRIRTNMEVFWDQAFVAEDVAVPELRMHTLQPAVAELRVLGYPREYSPDGRDPTIYDYQRIDRGVPFKVMSGDYTRFGDVRPLLAAADDRFVVMGKGEEIALEFEARSLPALPEGWTRTLVLYCDGYCKDMDLYTAFPDTVEPLPHHGMQNYPPARPPADTEAFDEYRRRWNTRRVSDR